MTPWWPFLGAHQAPFTRDIPVERLWLTPALREWQARFAAVVTEHGLAVLTGESGVGKSTALRLVWQTLTLTHYLPLYLPVSDAWTPRQLYRGLARLLDLPPTPFADATERQVRDTLWTLATQQGRLPVLALDEAHLLTPRLLQELRFLLLCRIPGYAESRDETSLNEAPADAGARDNYNDSRKASSASGGR